MNKKHSALTLVIALSLLAFAFALPKASFATDDVAEEDVAVEDIVDDSDDTFGSPVKMTKEEYDKYIPAVNDLADKVYKEKAKKIEPWWNGDDKSTFFINAFDESGIKDGYYITEDGTQSETLRDVGLYRLQSHYNTIWFIVEKDMPAEISQYFDELGMDPWHYGVECPLFDVDKSVANPIDECVKTDNYRDFLDSFLHFDSTSEDINLDEDYKKSREAIKAAGYEPVLTLVDTNFEGKEAGDLLYKVTYEKVSDDKPAVEVKDNDVMKIENKDFKLGTDKTVAVEIQKDFDTFGKDVKVYVDGKLVAPENYTVTKGSIIITFKESFLKTLGEGKHEFKTVFSDNTETKTTFNIVTPKKKADAPKKDVVPQTSDVYSAVTVLMTAVSGAAALKASRKF